MARPALALCVPVFALLATLSARPAAADYKDTYKKAMEAVDRGNWKDVERLMRQAAAEQPKEGERVKLYGMRFEEYLPQYYLGLALFQGGDCEAALAAWQASVAQGAVLKSGVSRTLAKHQATCETRLAQAKPKPPAGPDPAAVARAAQAAEAAIAQAEQQAGAASGLQSDPALAAAWGGEAKLGGAQREAAALLATAQGRLESGRRQPNLAELQLAQTEATRAARQLEGVVREAGLRREAARRAAAQKTPVPAPASAAPAGPPADVLAAARAYFGGEYQQAVTLLGRVSVGAGRAGAQSMMIRAAARHALYLLSGRRDEGLKRDAEADVRACRRFDPTFTPDGRYFSPRFAEFFRTVR